MGKDYLKMESNSNLKRKLILSDKQIKKVKEVIEKAKKAKKYKYTTIQKYLDKKNITFQLKVAQLMGRKASQISRREGVEIRKVPDPVFKEVNSYREDIIEIAVDNVINNKDLNMSLEEFKDILQVKACDYLKDGTKIKRNYQYEVIKDFLEDKFNIIIPDEMIQSDDEDESTEETVEASISSSELDIAAFLRTLGSITADVYEDARTNDINFGTLVKAVAGIADAIPEVKDLNKEHQEELIEIFKDLIEENRNEQNNNR